MAQQVPSGPLLVVDDHPVVRRGMAALFADEPWVTEVLDADGAAQARRLATVSVPVAALVDLGLPDGDGIQLIGELLRVVPECAVLVVTMTHDPGAVRAAMDAGARGYVLKDTEPDVLVAALRTVAAGGRVLGPGVGTDAPPGRAGPRTPLSMLTPRERRLLGLLAAGRSNREMARILSISEKTVRNQLSLLTAKLGVADRVQAALLAQRAGLTD